MLVRAKAPLRVSFAGGGTDVPPFPETESGMVLSATISRYAYGSLCSRSDGVVSLESVDSGVSLAFGVHDDPRFDGRLDLAKAAIRRIAPSGSHRSGYDIVLRSTTPPGSGLGASSALMVALVGLLREHHRLPLTAHQTAQLAWEIERRDLGLLGGMQDHYAATFGGFNVLEFGPAQTIVNPLRIRDSIVHELELNLLLCYTGVTRQSATIIADQTARVRAGDPRVLDSLRTQKELKRKITCQDKEGNTRETHL